MPVDNDALIERRRLRRRLAFWRAGAIVAAVAALFGFLLLADDDALALIERPRVARLNITGVIVENRWLEQALADLARDDKVRAVIVRIDSPGGSTYGGEALYAGLRRLAQRKPTVAVIGTLGASAAYLAAIGTDRIWAGDTSLTGSIGVLMQTAEVSGLLDKIGVTAETVKAGRLKDEPSYAHPLSEAGRAALQALVDETHRWFIDKVAERRKLEREKVVTLADGRVFNGTTALDVGLIDALGGEVEARRWLSENKGIPRSLKTLTERYGPKESLWREVASEFFGKSLLAERLTLDGLVSVWHPR